MLCTGGILVLEPQPWRSYVAATHKRQTCAVSFRNLSALTLRPDEFTRVLTEVRLRLSSCGG